MKGNTDSGTRAALLICTAIFFVSCSLLLTQAMAGIGPARAVVNVGSLAAIAFFAGLAISGISLPTPPCHPPSPAGKYLIFVALAGVPFLLTLQSPLLFDAYSHVVKASRETWQQAAQSFYVHPHSGDFFFRPIGYFDYWAEAQWAGLSFARWNILGIALHLLASLLVFVLCRSVNLSGRASLGGALVFGLHGTNPEAVSWAAARFDELATVFSLVTLVSLCKYLDTGRWYGCMMLGLVCALLSKEAAYCLPGLALCIIWFRGSFHARAWRTLLGLCAFAAILFTYRLWVLGSIGGYFDPHGKPTILHFSYLHFLELLSFRMWSVLLFPINWSFALEWWLQLGILCLLAGATAILLVARPSRRQLWAALSFCLVAILPASHLALLDARLTGSRVYHLALIGLALLVAVVAEGFSNANYKALALGGLLLFQLAALCHNLLIWRHTALLAGQVCQSFPALMTGPSPAQVEGLPVTHDGVFFLSNGFADCVFVNSGARVDVNAASAGTPLKVRPIYRWDEDTASITVMP